MQDEFRTRPRLGAFSIPYSSSESILSPRSVPGHAHESLESLAEFRAMKQTYVKKS